MNQEAQKFKSACILCDSNCGLLITVEKGQFTKIQGDKEHPASKGYVCQKPLRLNYYQNHDDRLTSPLKRCPDGSFEKISWDQAISEIAARMLAIRDEHGGRAFAFCGGGGQGNHLQGIHSAPLRRTLGTRYYYQSLAQEKTGDFWVAGKLFGKQYIHATPDQIEHSDYVVFIGTNPWQAHGFPHARVTLKDIKNDPARTMVVIDPRRTETAEIADLHLAVRPGQDAFLLAAMLGVMVQEDLVDHEFLTARTVGVQRIFEVFGKVPVARYAERAGIAEDQVRQVARGIARAKRALVRHDLGLEQSLHSTLNSYLDKLLTLLTGQFGREGTLVFHTAMLPLIGHSEPGESGDYDWRSGVTGMMPIAGLYPGNILPAEIDSDHPHRLRSLIVDSMNIANTAADTQAMRRALARLELLVVVDVAMSETAELAHYVLPAASQFEKWEATGFNFGAPTNHFHLRRPFMKPAEGTLPEAEIYRRLTLAVGGKPMKPIDKFADELDEEARLVLSPLHLLCRAYAKSHADAVRRAGIVEEKNESLGDALFRKIITSPSGTHISTSTYEELWAMIEHEDGKIHLVIEEMLQALDQLNAELDTPLREDDFPLILAAGERRAYNANQIYRNPAWRKDDEAGGLRIHPDDAALWGFADGETVACVSKRSAIEVTLAFDEAMARGFVSLPHGYGMNYAEAGTGMRKIHGPRINMLTASSDCDPIAKTPYHKYVPVRLMAKAGRVELT
jgi:anaerobic selenocysteine-containing dehydrogenase